MGPPFLFGWVVNTRTFLLEHFGIFMRPMLVFGQRFSQNTASPSIFEEDDRRAFRRRRPGNIGVLRFGGVDCIGIFRDNLRCRFTGCEAQSRSPARAAAQAENIVVTASSEVFTKQFFQVVA